MRIKRYLASDTKSAMAMVRAELGQDAMILSNRRVDGRIEITAALDLDDLIEAPSPANPVRGGAIRPPRPEEPGQPANEVQLMALQRELTRLREMLESELGRHGFRAAPASGGPVAVLRQRLLRLGLSRTLVGELIDELPRQQSLASSWLAAVQGLSRRIAVAPPAASRDAIVAVVGSTGVGKTTSIAKLAGLDVRRYGADRVGLITLDSYRIGAREQLACFGRALGLPILSATDAESLSRALQEMRGRRIYIDSAGMGQNDERLRQQLRLLRRQRTPIRTLLVLSASAQPSQLRAIAARFADAEINGVIVTKVDEALSLGGILDVLVSAGLPLHSVSDGQIVPDDLHPADPDWLVEHAVNLAGVSRTAPLSVARAAGLAS